MAARIRELGSDGSVVAVVGIDHLDPLVALLEGPDDAA
jgi:pheromone shutdown protein TraB